MLLTIVADDLTGARDTGALFTGPGRVGVFVAPAGPGGDRGDGGARHRDPERQHRGCPDACDTPWAWWLRLRRGRLFKKIDSTCAATWARNSTRS